MAPVAAKCSIRGNQSNLESGRDSGSDSEGGESSGSGSRSSSVDSEAQNRRSSRGSDRSKSRSPSPANSQASGSSGSPGRRSRRDSASSGSQHGMAEQRSRSGSRSPAGEGGNQSPNSFRNEKSASRSPSPGDQKSGSASPARSDSPADDKSNASEKNVDRSRSPSPGNERGRKSRSRSAGSNASRQSSGGSRSGSAESETHSKGRSESGAKSPREKSGSPDERQGSKSPSKKSRSPSESDSDDSTKKKSSRQSKSSSNKSESPHKSMSGSPQSDRSGVQSQKKGSNRSRSGSPRSGSGSDGEAKKGTPRKRKRAVLSDDSGSEGGDKKDEDTNENKDDGDESEKDLVIDAEALFGDASDISSDEGGKKKKSQEKVSDAEEKKSHDEGSEGESPKAQQSGEEDVEMEDGGEKEDEDKENLPEEPIPETRIDVEIPKITTDLGKDIHFVKLPNFLSVETRPFDPSTYEDEIDEEETLDEEGRARLKLKVENTIRWKEVTKQNGEFDKQSNARFVRWSDGSMSLHLGSEIFDVYKQPLQGDHNHLFIRQGTGLQGQAVFRTKLTFRPHSTESFTHRKMTMSLADRSQKTAGIKVLSLVGKDPEAHRGELIKKEEERLRASVRRESKQRRIREKGAHRGLSAGYLEPDRYGDGDSDDEGISISAIKKQHRNKMINSRDDRSHIYSSDEDGSDIETRRAKRLDKAKALKDSDSEGSGDKEDGRGGNKSGDGTSSGED